MDIVALILTLALFIFLITGLVLLNRAQEEERLEKRLQNISLDTKIEYQRYTSNLPEWLQFGRMMSQENRSKLKSDLSRAGFNSDQALNYLLLCKFLFAIVATALYLSTQNKFDFQVIAVAVVIAVFANMLPEFLIKRRADTIRRRISGDLPACLDLMVICAESGLTIDAALLKVSNSMATLAPAISREFEITYYELQLPTPRDKAWINLATRNNLKVIDGFSYIMRQTEKYGTSLAPALREIAAETREITMLELEEKIGKISGRMSVPLMLFVVLPLVVMLAAPALISLGRVLTGE